MKKLALFGTLVLFAAGLLTGCEESNPLDTNAGSIRAKVDGSNWINTVANATRLSPPGSVTISSTGSSESLYLNLNQGATGTYSLAGGGNSGKVTRGGTEYSSANSGGSGTVTVTSFDESSKTISGTFSFVAKSSSGSTVSVTEGSFSNIKWVEG